jgi:hypothetical protein
MHWPTIGTAAFLCVTCAPAQAQWLNYPTPGLPRTADGKPNLSAPAPRTSDGKPDLSGVWRMGAGKYRLNVAADLTPGEILPWAAAASRRSLDNLGANNEVARCLPPGPRIMANSVLFKIVQTPLLTLFLHESDNNYFRQVFTDGRELPKEPNPAWFGYSVGHWEQETFVVETTGFNGKAALDAFGHPHTEALRLTERYRRRDFGHIDLEMTYDDPNAYARPFTVTQDLRFIPDDELLEFVCNENERDVAHLVGRTGPTIRVAPDLLARYAGTYEAGPGNRIVITVDGDQLMVDQRGLGPLPLTPQSEKNFLLEAPGLGPPSQYEFLLNPQGIVTDLVWHRASGEDLKVVRTNASGPEQK